MKQIFFPATLLSAVLALSLHMGCQREPVYYGILPDPSDTTGNGGGGTMTQPCSPDSVYFEQQILPFLRSNCAQSGCHDAVSAEDEVVLDNYTNVRNTGGIKLNNPADSKLYKVLIDNDPDDRMPPAPAAPLSTDQRALILQWIQQGAQNLRCDAACDTSNVRFSTVIQPLLNAKCTGCHNAGNAGGGVNLASYAGVKTTVDNQTLWGAVNHQSGFKPMPYPAGGARLPNCEIDQIRIWIQDGAPNN